MFFKKTGNMTQVPSAVIHLTEPTTLPNRNITMTKDFLAGLTVEWHPLALESSSINGLGLNNGIFGNFP